MLLLILTVNTSKFNLPVKFKDVYHLEMINHCIYALYIQNIIRVLIVQKCIYIFLFIFSIKLHLREMWYKPNERKFLWTSTDIPSTSSDEYSYLKSSILLQTQTIHTKCRILYTLW